MTDTAFDRPDVIVFPPVIPLTTLAVACVLQWLVPLRLDRRRRTAGADRDRRRHRARRTGQ